MKTWMCALVVVWVVNLGLVDVLAADECQRATGLVIQAFDAGEAGAAYAEQKVLLQEALQRCPEHAEAHNNLAAILEEEGDYERALSHYRRALKTKPDFAAAWNNRAYAEQALGHEVFATLAQGEAQAIELAQSAASHGPPVAVTVVLGLLLALSLLGNIILAAVVAG